RRGRSTLVVERSTYEAVRIGETLPPRIRSLLITLGVWEAFLEQRHLPSFGTRAAWGSRRLHANDFICDPDGCGWHTDRVRFDAMLAREAERAGAIVCRGTTAVSCHRDPTSGWKVGLTAGERAVEVRARFVVDATGRRLWLARREGARPIIHDQLIG